jgi:molybdopterin-guanine dinucleotide biosynthesis protein A
VSRVAGIVLCGGHSRRMGRPKAWLPIGEETFLQRIVRVVGEAVDEVIVVAAEGQELPPLPPHIRRVDDLWPDRGPLGGFATGLAAVGLDCEAVFLTACDMPFLTAPFVRSVVDDLLKSDSDVLVPVTKDCFLLSAAYRTRVRPFVEGKVRAGELRMTDLLELRCVANPIAMAFRECIQNVNTPEDYERFVLSRPSA